MNVEDCANPACGNNVDKRKLTCAIRSDGCSRAYAYCSIACANADHERRKSLRDDRQPPTTGDK